MFNKRFSLFGVVFISFWLSILTKRVLSGDKSANPCNRLPDGCRINSIYDVSNIYSREFAFSQKVNGFVCDVKDKTARFVGFTLKFVKNFSRASCFSNKSLTNTFEIRFPTDQKTKLDEHLNLRTILEFQNTINPSDSKLKLTNVAGFSVDLDVRNMQQQQRKSFENILVKANLDFFANGRLVRSCRDLESTFGPKWSPDSLIQISSKYNKPSEFLLFNCRFK